MRSTPERKYSLPKLRRDGEAVADKAVISDPEDRRFPILVDGDDGLGGNHAGEMQDRAGDADRLI